MSQTWNSNSYQGDHEVDTDMNNIENNLNTLRSMFSGVASPANPEVGMPWFDRTNKLLRIRNEANSAWLGVMYGNSDSKIWMYINAAPDGWVIDSSVTDRVLALKGGSLSYNVAGGNTGGDWTLTHSHTTPSHALTTAELASHRHYLAPGCTSDAYNSCGGINYGVADETEYGDDYTDYEGDGDAHSHGDTGNALGTTWRTAAAVGIMVYPNA